MNRPTVTLNVATSLDGKIASPFRVSLTSPADRRRVEIRRSEADAVLLGAETVRVEDAVSLIRFRDLIEARRRRGEKDQPIQVVWSRSGRLSPQARFFRTPGLDRIVFLSGTSSRQVAEALRPFAIVHCTPEADVDPGHLLSVLASEHGVRRLLLECGGRSTRPFFHAGLVDEIFLTLTPKVLAGRDSPTPVDGEALPSEAVSEFSLAEVEREGDHLFLHYRRRP